MLIYIFNLYILKFSLFQIAFVFSLKSLKNIAIVRAGLDVHTTVAIP